MKVEFYEINTGVVLSNTATNNYYFIMNDEVYKDNNRSYESQEATVDFDDFIVRMCEIGWRVVA